MSVFETDIKNNVDDVYDNEDEVKTTARWCLQT